MQTTSALYNQIIAGGNYWYETRLIIDDVGTFAETGNLFSISTARQAVENKPAVGNAVAGEINIKMVEPSTAIPRMGTLRPQVRVCNDTQQSEWLSKGIYFVDTRQYSESGDESILTIHGYDAMMKGEQAYPDTNHAWPYLDTSVVAEIATAMGVTVDSRTYDFLTSGYMIELPANYTCREVLGNIAAMYGGNFIMSDEGKLLFVPLYGLDEPTVFDYLADQNGNALVFGNEGWCILV